MSEERHALEPEPVFWMVLRDGTTYTSYRHETEESARKEAERLARENPNTRFYVLRCVGAAICLRSPVAWMPSFQRPF